MFQLVRPGSVWSTRPLLLLSVLSVSACECVYECVYVMCVYVCVCVCVCVCVGFRIAASGWLRHVSVRPRRKSCTSRDSTSRIVQPVPHTTDYCLYVRIDGQEKEQKIAHSRSSCDVLPYMVNIVYLAVRPCEGSPSLYQYQYLLSQLRCAPRPPSNGTKNIVVAAPAAASALRKKEKRRSRPRVHGMWISTHAEGPSTEGSRPSRSMSLTRGGQRPR
ncbi:hypothetical protein LY76DRAFT_397744 [Colletotrichum caudatum]|nr:hypothetical protein LY76DRAFT_397744 [Colletotrichum caudatum]